MKYLKTKDNIYDIDDLFIEELLNEKPYVSRITSGVIYKRDIINESDDLEDLIDLWVITGRDKKYLFASNEVWKLSQMLEIMEMQQYAEGDLFGIIVSNDFFGKPIFKTIARYHDGKLLLIKKEE